MLKLTLLRHAKSTWDDPELTDHERQLTKRGTKAAIRIGCYIAENQLTPELILCSDAIRARATLALVLGELRKPVPPTTITNELYLASPGTILRVLVREAGNARNILVIGHNPGLHALALSLPSASRQSDMIDLAMKFPTAALAHITFDVNEWSNLQPASGCLERFIVPRMLNS